MSMSFSTAELFQTSTNGSMTQIRKGNTMKLNKNHNHNHNNHSHSHSHAHNNSSNNHTTYTRRRHDPQDSAAFNQHVPHNSKDDHYRFYDDIGTSNIFEHDHVEYDHHQNNNNPQQPPQHQQSQSHPHAHPTHSHVKHNVSMASVTHNRGGTFSKYLLDDTLEVIDGDIPSQKEIMKDFFEERVHTHLQQQSSRFEDMQQLEEDTPTHHDPLDDFGGTMRQINSSNVTTPLDESDLINFGDMENIDIPDYTDDDEEEKGIDPMQLIAQKNKLKSKNKKGFPDTQPITAHIAATQKKKKRRRHNNTSRSPLPQVGDITPASVVFKPSDSDSDADTYENSSDDSEPAPAPQPHAHASRGSQQRVFDNNENNKLLMTADNNSNAHPVRSGTMTNIAKLMSSASKQKQTQNKNRHRHSRSEVPKSFIKKNELFNIYQSQNNIHSAKQYLANMTQMAKTNKSVVEKKALKEMEKKYKPQLQKTQQELDEARRKSLKQEQEMKTMKRELEALRREKHDDILSKKQELMMKSQEKKPDFVINQKLRKKNLEIQELQSKLKFEKERLKIGMSPIIYTTPPSFNQFGSDQQAPSTHLIHNAVSAPDAMNSAAAVRSARTLILNNHKSKSKKKENQNMIKSKSSAQLFAGLNRLKARNPHGATGNAAAGAHRKKQYISMKDLKKRKSLPEELAKKHKRPLWTHRSAMKKSKTLETWKIHETNDENKKKMARLGIKNRLIKKRESLLLPPNPMTMRPRHGHTTHTAGNNNNNLKSLKPTSGSFFDRNLMKRNSWHAHDGEQGGGRGAHQNVDYDKLKGILVAAQRQNAKSKTKEKEKESEMEKEREREREKYADIEAKYKHLLAENEHLRKENFGQKDELKKYKAPPPSSSHDDLTPTAPAPAPPILLIKRKQKKNVKNKNKSKIGRKRLSQVARSRMMPMDWIPIDDDVIKDTRWRYLSNNDNDIVIPDEFERLFCVEKQEEKEEKSEREMFHGSSITKGGISSKRASWVERILSGGELKNISAAEIRGALLRVDESVLSSRSILYDLLSIAPNISEQKFIQNKYRRIDGYLGSGSVCEEFFYQLSDIGHLELRLQLMTFKCTFSSTMNDIFCDLFVLNGALKSIQRSSHLERILSLILSFGNFMNSKQTKKYGINGFELESLDRIGEMNDFLRYLCKYCDNEKNNKYRNCITQCIAELDETLYEFNKKKLVSSYDCYQKILLITEELSKFGRSLRKFRKQAIATSNNNNNNNEKIAYKQIENDLFESMMRDFLRRAHLVCKSLLDLHQEIVAIADIISSQYNYRIDENNNSNSNRIEHLLQMFATFICKLKCAQNLYLRGKEKKRGEMRRKRRINSIRNKLDLELRKIDEKNNQLQKKKYVYSADELERREKEREENMTKLSKLIYQHCILMDLDAFQTDMRNNHSLSVQRIKYLKGLAKSNELPNQLSNNPEAIQKERNRRRRRSLTNTDIQIGQKMQMTLAEDEEMK